MLLPYVTPQVFIIAGIILCLYILIAGVVYCRKLVTHNSRFAVRQTDKSVMQTAGTRNWSADDLLPPLIDRPQNHAVTEPEEYDEDGERLYEMVDMEDITLLKEAEKVVEEIQEVVNKIQSFPANPEEVFSKIKNIVSDYTIFIGTEYYEAINSFILVTVQRDCDLTLSIDDLKALWYSEAA